MFQAVPDSRSVRVSSVALLGATLVVVGLYVFSGTSADAGAGGILSPNRSPATVAAPDAEPGQAVAVFAGGCFWCMEKPFDTLPGVISTTSGYAGGMIQGPSYKEVGMGRPSTSKPSTCSTTRPRCRMTACSKCSGATSIPHRPTVSSATGQSIHHGHLRRPDDEGGAHQSGRVRRARRYVVTTIRLRRHSGWQRTAGLLRESAALLQLLGCGRDAPLWHLGREGRSLRRCRRPHRSMLSPVVLS